MQLFNHSWVVVIYVLAILIATAESFDQYTNSTLLWKKDIKIFASSFLGNPEEEMKNRFRDYFNAKIDETEGAAKGMICDETKGREYRWWCYNPDGVPDCDFPPKSVKGQAWRLPYYVEQDLRKGKHKKDKGYFLCNKPCGCYIGQPEVETSQVNFHTFENPSWEDVEAKLNEWSVKGELYSDFNTGTFFDGTDFQVFSFFYEDREGKFQAYAGSTRRVDNQLLIGYSAVKSKCWLDQKAKTKFVQDRTPPYAFAREFKEKIGYSSDEIVKINAALQNKAYRQLRDRI